MKQSKLLSLMMALFASVLLLGACDDDNENNSNNGNNNQQGQVANGIDQQLVGTWTSIISEGWEYNENGVTLVHWKDLSAIKTERWEYDGNGAEISHNTYTGEPEWETTYFGADGTYYDTNEDGEQNTGRWQASNGNLTLFVNGRTVTYTYSFNGNTLIVDTKEYDEEDGQRYLSDREVIYYERGTFDHNTNTIDPTGTYTPNQPTPVTPTDSTSVTPVPTPAGNFLGTLPSLWKSYFVTAEYDGQTQSYDIKSTDDEEYIEIEFRANSQARYSFWNYSDDDDQTITRALVKKAIRRALRATSTWESIIVNYQVSGNSVSLYNEEGGLTLNYNAAMQSLVLSITESDDYSGQSVTVNILFRK